MERVLTFFRDNPGFAAVALIIAIASFLGIVFTVAFVRAGLSLRPLVFLAGFFALILVPQLVGHLLTKRGVLPDLTWTPALAKQRTLQDDDAALAAENGRFLHPHAVFGDDIDPAFVRDAREAFGPVVIAAETAQVVFALERAETVLAARFPSPAQAQDAQRRYFAHLGLRHPKPGADGSCTASRAGGDFVRTLAAGRTLFAWSGADDAALERRARASAAAWRTGNPTPPDPKRQRLVRLEIGFLALNLIAVSLWFFKGSAWAVREGGQPGVARVVAGDLRAQLLAIDRLPQPIAVKATGQPDEIEVTWRDADATWLDTARLRGLRRMHRLVLRLDDATQTVRVREFVSGIDWSVGKGGLSFNWKRQTGITFYQVDYQRVFGLQLAADGQLEPALSYAYTFDVQELKRPLAHLVTSRGWTWQPLVWNAPAWLRWATE